MKVILKKDLEYAKKGEIAEYENGKYYFGDAIVHEFSESEIKKDPKTFKICQEKRK